MNLNEFERQMDRLKSVYGDKAYPDERAELIWKEMRYLPVHQFEEIVGEMIASSAQAPMMGKFREAKQDLGRRHASEYEQRDNDWTDTQPDCHDCDKTGSIVATLNRNQTIYAFRCPCPIGERKHPKLPKWGVHLFSEYTPGVNLNPSINPIRCIPKIEMKKITD